jgi:probable HAF family extracellular repeat protein
MKKLTLTLSMLIAMLTAAAWPHDTQAAPSGYYDTVQRVYIGYYQRPADPGGLLYWAGRLDNANGNLNEIIEAYANSPESQALYGTINGSNISSVVDSIYITLFGRPAEAEGKVYYVNGFNAGRFTAAAIVLNVLNGAQNEDLASVNDKITASNLFTRAIDPELDGRDFQYNYSGNGAAQRARAFLSAVTSDPATIPTEDELREYFVPTTFYAYTTLLPEGWLLSVADAINNNGQVVGRGMDASYQWRVFLYSNGTYTTLFPEGWAWSQATGINNNGQVVGYGQDASMKTRGSLYSNGTYTTLLPEGWAKSYATGINDNGQVVGDGEDALGQARGFLYSNGSYSTLIPEGWGSAHGVGINNNGQVVGYGEDALGQPRGFLYSNGTYTILFPEGWAKSYARKINNNGDVAGDGEDALGTMSGFFYSNGTYTTLFPMRLLWPEATGINDSGQVVISGQDFSWRAWGFLCSNGTYTTQLPEGWAWSQATGINDNGQVVGYGEDALGQTLGFIVTPQ